MSLEFTGSGSGDHVDLGAWDLPSGLSTLSIFAWVKFDSFTVPDQRIISKATSSASADHWWMFSSINSNQMRVRLKTGGTTLTHFENSAAITTGIWWHMGFVYNGTNVLFYRNGQQSGSSSQTGNLDTNGSVGVRIADNPGPDRLELDGHLDDLTIHQKALTLAEIKTKYFARGHDGIVDGLLHRWLFNDGYPGQTATGASSVRDYAGVRHGSPAASPVYRASELSFRRG